MSSGYTVHAGAVRESSGARGQQLNYRGNPEWYDFGACHVATDGEGYCEVKKDGMRHVAVRTCGRESKYRPSVRLAMGCSAPRLAAAQARKSQVKNIAPRQKDWKKPEATKQEQ